MKIATRAASVCSLVVLTALLGFSIFEGVGAVRGTWRIVPVLSGSMRPQLPTGSAAITWKTPLSDLHVGSVVAYAIPVDDHHVEMHRVVSLKRVPGGVVIHTKGDANNGPDPWAAKLTGTSFWRVGMDFPKLGWPIVELQKPFFRLAATLFAAFGFMLSSRRRPADGAGDVVDVRVAEAVVGALEEELAHERTELRGEIETLARRLALFQEEDSHRRRMRDVDDLLADLRGERVTDAEPVTPVHAVVAPLEAAEAEAPSLLDVLDERIAAVRAGTAGLAA
jgi:signal peptidase